MKIRIAKNEDVEQVWNIGNNVSEFKTAENVVIFWPKETLENCINKDDILFYVVEAENNIIGFSIVNLNKSNCLADEATEFYERYGFAKGRDFAWMDIALSDNFKRGISTK